MSTRDIEAHRREIYGVDVSATLISQVTEEVMDEVPYGKAVRWSRYRSCIWMRWW